MSTISANDLQNTSGGIPTVKGQRLIPTAWVNFNGTGTVAIRDSENVSSITDNAVGNYSMNFAVDMLNTNYSVSGTAGGVDGVTAQCIFAFHHNVAKTISSIRLTTLRGSVDAYIDTDTIHCVVMGGQ